MKRARAFAITAFVLSVSGSLSAQTTAEQVRRERVREADLMADLARQD
jgi:hypothetical protein